MKLIKKGDAMTAKVDRTSKEEIVSLTDKLREAQSSGELITLAAVWANKQGEIKQTIAGHSGATAAIIRGLECLKVSLLVSTFIQTLDVLDEQEVGNERRS
jgi:hypothetical protein